MKKEEEIQKIRIENNKIKTNTTELKEQKRRLLEKLAQACTFPARHYFRLGSLFLTLSCGAAVLYSTVSFLH